MFSDAVVFWLNNEFGHKIGETSLANDLDSRPNGLWIFLDMDDDMDDVAQAIIDQLKEEL